MCVYQRAQPAHLTPTKHISDVKRSINSMLCMQQQERPLTTTNSAANKNATHTIEPGTAQVNGCSGFQMHPFLSSNTFQYIFMKETKCHLLGTSTQPKKAARERGLKQHKA
jgi:hypothetical protein